MTPSAEFLITCAGLAAVWLSLRHDIRALTAELRKTNGDPNDKRDLEFDKALAVITRTMSEPHGSPT